MTARIVHEARPEDLESLLPVEPAVQEAEALMWALRRQQGWGSRRIHSFLTKAGIQNVPSKRTIDRRLAEERERL